jgi:hypothetical protein
MVLAYLNKRLNESFFDCLHQSAKLMASFVSIHSWNQSIDQIDLPAFIPSSLTHSKDSRRKAAADSDRPA